jgi:prepilin-type N-terminal cleavage/methylation domain-containing protein
VKKLKIENRKLKINRGFTLIELLIVITLLGILAVAVLSAINPIEQINRSRDTATRSDAEQLISAIERYYATRGYYPWVEGADEDYQLDWQEVTDTWVDAGGETVLGDNLATGGTAELKETFVNRITDSSYNPLYIFNNGTQGDSTYVCFQPQSGAFEEEAEDRCLDVDGNLDVPSDYPASGDIVATGASICGGDVNGDDSDTEEYWICLP